MVVRDSIKHLPVYAFFHIIKVIYLNSIIIFLLNTKNFVALTYDV